MENPLLPATTIFTPSPLHICHCPCTWQSEPFSGNNSLWDTLQQPWALTRGNKVKDRQDPSGPIAAQVHFSILPNSSCHNSASIYPIFPNSRTFSGGTISYSNTSYRSPATKTLLIWRFPDTLATTHPNPSWRQGSLYTNSAAPTWVIAMALWNIKNRNL